MGAVGLLHHIEEGHPGLSRESGNPSLQPQPTPPQQQRPPRPTQQRPPLPQLKLPPPPQLQLQRPPPPQLQLPPPQQQLPPPPSQQQQQPPPSHQQHPPTPPPSFPATSPDVVNLRPPVVNWVSFLPKQFLRVINPADQEWIAQCLYKATGCLRQEASKNWFLPPDPPKLTNVRPDPMAYFRQRMFLWAPMRMWSIPIKCVQCNSKMHHSGIYPKAREVIDLDSSECGQLLNCVLTTVEGAGLDELCRGIVKRYKKAGEPEPEVIYVDRDCCSGRGTSPVLSWLRPWKTTVRLDIFHFMRRFTRGLTTEHHPIYGTFCSKLSNCIFEWDQDDICRLKEAKKSKLQKQHAGHAPTEAQVLANISSSELARHCKRRTLGVEETRRLIDGLLESMWELTDTTGLRLINPESMTKVWETPQKHLTCIQDPPGVELYTKVRSGSKKGDKVLDVLRCGRGSSSV
ncbi:unnamed protein product [Pleuronectes platessa]|uniref:DUF6729 domain-containing protein n=1 Tax=Pleuronectes platessa TaxID=8262 RepID=A0A9N7U802_PLEPL|nr:unnamed protein product [Pleuronectes platessa]